MTARRSSLLVRSAAATALVLVLAGCTSGGNFDPTMIFNNDMFDTKKKLQGDRAPVFPNGVPGTTSGVPADLVKGYQPPPEPSEAEANGAPPAAAEPPKPKPKPKPKVARAPATPPPRISVGPGQGAPAPQAGAPAQTNWPAPPQQQGAPPAQPAWPAPPRNPQ
jgi:hypothetical protein